MKWRRAVAWVLRATLGMYVAIAPAYAADEEARVLILNGIDPYLPAYLGIDGAMRASLAKDEARRIVFFSEALDGQRFSPEALEPEFLALLEKKYRAVHIDVVVAFSIPALEFFKRHGAHLWPGARLVFHGFPGEDIRPETLPPNATAVEARPDVDGTIELAQRLQPDARRIVVIAGVSDLDRRAEQLARGALSKPAEHATVEFLSGLPLPELVARVAAEPASTIVIYLAQFRDRDGRPYTPREVLRAISDASVAPVYGVAETFIGFGAAAGVVESYEARGSSAASRCAPPWQAGLPKRAASCSRRRAIAWRTRARCSAGRSTRGACPTAAISCSPSGRSGASTYGRSSPCWPSSPHRQP